MADSDSTKGSSGLKGDEISLYAGIIHITDAFDSMTADRPYRLSLGKAEVMILFLYDVT